jgi:hypothetical protein
VLAAEACNFLRWGEGFEYIEHVACPRIGDCELFPLFVLRQNLRFWQRHYCEGDFEKCERLQRQRAGEAVPATLLPNGKQIKVVLRPGQVRRSED